MSASPRSPNETRRPARATTSQDIRVVLMGMMGAGKTTIGRLLATRLGALYLDNDEAIRGMTGREPAEIGDTDGEAALHQLESEALGWALDGPPPMIVGAAGGIIEDPHAIELLGDDTTVVWLRATPETLLARIGAGHGRRAEATDLDWITQRAIERDPAYRALADLVIDVDDLTPDEVVDRLAASLARRAELGGDAQGRSG
jgi:shikimate kinase